MPTYKGSLNPPQGRFAIVASKFNREIVERLVAGAKDALHQHGVAEESIDVVWVPGAFEIAFMAHVLAARGPAGGRPASPYVAIICVGAVIRGDTDHYDYVCKAATDGILQAGLANVGLRVPVLFGVLTCDTEEQALDRAGGTAGNKGFDVAEAAIEMVNLLGQL
jgi:6,7-dimethyl-8-ribityllumazine synthase